MNNQNSKGVDTNDSRALAPVSASAGGMSLGELSTKAAAVWCGPLTQNHDPQFWKSLREAYAQGYMRGFNECASRKQNAPGEPRRTTDV